MILKYMLWKGHEARNTALGDGGLRAGIGGRAVGGVGEGKAPQRKVKE